MYVNINWQLIKLKMRLGELQYVFLLHTYRLLFISYLNQNFLDLNIKTDNDEICQFFINDSVITVVVLCYCRCLLRWQLGCPATVSDTQNLSRDRNRDKPLSYTKSCFSIFFFGLYTIF